jgi:predicted nucleic acid-binding Zn ribbon protein
MSRRRAPRSAAFAVHDVLDKRAPRTLLAAVQSEWERVCGPAVAAEAQPVAEREGVVTVACRSATWAQELDLMQEDLAMRLDAALSGHELKGLRFTADAARHGVD